MREQREKPIKEAVQNIAVQESGTNTYLALDNVHHEFDRDEIGGEREAVRHELKEGNTSGPDV